MQQGQGPLDEAAVATQVGVDVVECVRTVHQAGGGAGVEGTLGVAFSGCWCHSDVMQGFAEFLARVHQVQFVEAEGSGKG
jgi:hypothetical protein